jgi:SAM-dependent methyltransferase
MDYDKVWRGVKVKDPRTWSSWQYIQEYLFDAGRFLELGPGSQPRIPVRGSYFVDASQESVEKLKSAGGKAVWASAGKLPWQEDFFDLVCAFELMEHVEGDEKAFLEIYRVLKKDGRFIFSVPLFMKYWTAWDEMAGHKRRYNPGELEKRLKEIGFSIEKFYTSKSPFLFLYASPFFKLLLKPITFLSRVLPSFLLSRLNNFYVSLLPAFNKTEVTKGKLSEIKNRHQVIVFCRKV